MVFVTCSSEEYFRGSALIAALALCVFFFGCGRGIRTEPPASSVPVSAQQAALAVQTLQNWYNPATGLWETTGWWNAANSVTVLARYSLISGSAQYVPVLSNTFRANAARGFLNKYYDDEGWWALAWIASYDRTRDVKYLNEAQQIFSDMTAGWDSTCGGGIWWNKDRKYKNAIANELFLSAAANLAARSTGSKKTEDLAWAQKEWAWFSASGMINSDNLINDGLNPSCQNNQRTTWTYNQGVILGGLASLSKDSGNTSPLRQAQTIALSAIGHLSDPAGILHDRCEPSCGADGVQFKGIFARNLAVLNSAQPLPQYADFLKRMPKAFGTTTRVRTMNSVKCGQGHFKWLMLRRKHRPSIACLPRRRLGIRSEQKIFLRHWTANWDYLNSSICF